MKYQVDLIADIIDSFTPALSSFYEPDRVVTTAFFGQVRSLPTFCNLHIVLSVYFEVVLELVSVDLFGVFI